MWSPSLTRHALHAKGAAMPVSYNSMGCSTNLPHKSLSMNKTNTCVGTVMASFKGCSIWPQLVGAAESAGRLPRKASKCGRTDDRVCSSAVRLTKAPRRCSRMSLMRDRSALTPSQSASILLACTKYQVHKSAYARCKPVVVYKCTSQLMSVASLAWSMYTMSGVLCR